MVFKKQTIEGHQIVLHRCKRFNDILLTLIEVFYTFINIHTYIQKYAVSILLLKYIVEYVK